MAVSGRCSGGRGVCEPSATLGCDWHPVNDTLLVDDPERIAPIQAIGMDQTLFNREYPTQQWTTTFDSPLEIRRADTGPAEQDVRPGGKNLGRHDGLERGGERQQWTA